MHSESIILYDLVKNKDDDVIKLINDEIDVFSQSQHLLKGNYKSITETIDDYLCFTVLVYENKLIGFSGLYNNESYPINTARVLNRLYYSSEFRTHSLFPKTNNNLNKAFSSVYMIPYQVRVASELGLDSVFISMENLKRRSKFKSQIQMSNKITGYNFKILPGMYNTCKVIDNKLNDHISCWQTIAVQTLNDNAMYPELACISEEEWKQRYEDNTYY